MAPIGGNTEVDIIAGAITTASLGDHTQATVSIGDVTNTIGGSLDSDITAGAVTAFSLGSHASAQAFIGTVSQPVGGNVTMNITTGEVFVGAMGYENAAVTHIGHIEKPVAGDLDVNITVGGVNNFSFGVGSGGDPLTSRISIGSVLSPQTAANEPTDINVHKGTVDAMSFGFTFHVPVLGTYFIGETGCESYGNVGSEGCSAHDNKLRITHE